MPITNISHSVNLSSLSNYYLNMPSNAGMSSGYWFYYSASVNNNVIGTKIVPYRWGQQLVTNEGTTLTMEGSIPLVSESLNRQRIFHGSTITRIGAGINDITLTPEEDAFFFYHMGSIAASDNPGYWDRAFKSSVASGDWEYYQYHLHSPNVYANFDQARVAQSAYTYIEPTDKRYGYMQPIQVSSMGQSYLNVLARIHQPSVGGAHNSHNDIELGSSTTTNYQIGGIIPGASNRFHAFYIAANGSFWNVYSRTYVLANGSFTAEVNHGIYDLADASINVTSRLYSLFPVRASSGIVVSDEVYIPVIYNSTGTPSGFDLRLWSFTSADTISTGNITVSSLCTGSLYRPDIHLTTVNNAPAAIVSHNSSTTGSIQFFKYTGSAWVNQGNLIVNGPQESLRIHGFEYNTQDNLYYVLVSGNITGSVAGSNYSGSGVYSFSDGITFPGYKHLSYITSSYGFQLRDPLQLGHLRYTNIDGTLIFNSGSEPQSLDETYEILQYDVASPKFYDKKEIHLDAKEYFYDGIRLQDGRTILVGNIEENEGNTGLLRDLFMAVYPETGGDPEYYAYSGGGNDYFTGIVEDTQRRCLWLTGYTRSELAQRRDIKIHGYGRALTDGNNFMEWRDIAVDSEGNQYTIGYHQSNDSIVAAKYNYNFELQWQRDINHDTYTMNEAHGIALDPNNNIYIAGTSDNKALVAKLDITGSTVFSKLYTNIFNFSGGYASSIAYVPKSSQEYLVVPIISGSSTIVTILDTTGSIVEQNELSNFIVNKVRKAETEDGGNFLLVGNDAGSPSKAKFAKGQILASGNMMKWIYTYSSGSFASDAFDIKNTEALIYSELGSGLGPKYHIVGKDNINAFTLKLVVDQNDPQTIYQGTKLWAKNIVSSSFSSLTSTLWTTDPSSSISTYIIGHTSGSPEGEGMDDAILTKFDYNGNRLWTNTLGHMGDDKLVSVTNDVTQDNILSVGYSESHTNGRRTFLFRSEINGFGTANYHLEGYSGLEMQYKSSSLAVQDNNGALTTISVSYNEPGNLFLTNESYNNNNGVYTEEIYDGGVSWDMFIAKIDLDNFQIHRNTEEHKVNNAGCDTPIEYIDFINFYQWGTAGDGTADDGNFFGYDILLMTGSNDVMVIGQTSGNIGFTNDFALSGTYDYILTKFNPETEEFEVYQSGSVDDEEVYSGTELNDGSGSIAFVGRSIGTFATSSQGGYDIFLGIYNPITDERYYFSTGSVLNDRGVNVHDLGSGQLAIVYESAGTVGGTNSVGGFDVGIMTFNYSNYQNNIGTWAVSSLRAGSNEDEFLSQDGSPSCILEDGRIVVVGRTLGSFADDGQSLGNSDIFVAIFDLTNNEVKKYQTGTQGNEFANVVFNLGGSQVGIAGYTDASFEEPDNALYTKFDAFKGPKARIS